MLIYHDGLPGSGKTYEAMVKHVLPALQSGRMVYARIDGLDYEKIANILSMDVGLIRSLLIYLEPSQIPTIHNHIVCDNSLVVIDELQNYWPSGRQKLSDDITSFISEHRHRGLDVLVMGQDYRDAHNLFKRRIDRKISFMNLDVMGSARSYKWNLYKQVGERFQKVSSGVERYDSKYFGIYKSHHSEGVNTDNYKDSRFVIWNDNLFRLAMIFVILVLFIAPFKIFHFFKSADPVVDSQIPVSSPQIRTQPQSIPIPTTPSLPVSTGAKSTQAIVQQDYIFQLSTNYRVRLTSLISSVDLGSFGAESGQKKIYVVVEFRDSSYRIQERLDQDSLTALGWRISVVNDRLIKLFKHGFPELVVTPWPIEPFSKVSDEQNEAVRRQGLDHDSSKHPADSSSSDSIQSHKSEPARSEPLLVRSPNGFQGVAPIGHVLMR